MRQRIRPVLEGLTRNLNAARFDEVVALYDYPFMLELEGEVSVLSGAAEALAAWARFHLAFRARGHARSAIRLRALELPQGGQFRAWTEFHHVNDQGRPSGCTHVTFRFRELGRRGLRLTGQAVTRKAADVGDSAILIIGNA